MNEAPTAGLRDRAAISAELQTTLAGSKDLIREIGDAHWKLKSSIPEWTCGQLAWHLASSMDFIAGQIEGARTGKALKAPGFLLPLLFKASEVRVRIASRKATPDSVLTDLDAGMARLFGVLEATDDETLAKPANAFFETRLIGEFFARPHEHFSEHAAHIRTAISRA